MSRARDNRRERRRRRRREERWRIRRDQSAEIELAGFFENVNALLDEMDRRTRAYELERQARDLRMHGFVVVSPRQS